MLAGGGEVARDAPHQWMPSVGELSEYGCDVIPAIQPHSCLERCCARRSWMKKATNSQSTIVTVLSVTVCSRSRCMRRHQTVGWMYCMAGSMVPLNPMPEASHCAVYVWQVRANQFRNVGRDALGVAEEAVKEV